MANIVVYARYSSEKQTEQSIEGQLRVCRDYAERNGHCIIKEYIDRAITGRNTKRPGFLQMIQDASKKQFSHILCYKLDRFSRNQYDSVIFKKELEKYGVTVISATEAISNTSEGRLVEGLLEIMAEMYSIDLSQKVKRGMRESFLKGNVVGGAKVLGYKVENKKFVIDEEKAALVRRIFDLYANGVTRQEIVDELNGKGYTNAKNKPFTTKGLQHVLQNEKYIGRYKYDGEMRESAIPQIVDKDTFDIVQKRLLKNKKGGGNKSKVDFLLRGKVFCGHCGSHMSGYSGTSKSGSTHYYYVCSNKSKSSCKKRNEAKDHLEDVIIEEIHNNILAKKKIKELSKWLFENIKKSCSSSQLDDFLKQIKKIEKDLDQCVDLMLKAKNPDILKRLEKQADSLTLQKEDLENECKKLKLLDRGINSADELEEYFSLFAIGDFHDEQHRKYLIRLFVDSIWAFDDKKIVLFNLPNDSNVLEFQDIKDIATHGEVFELMSNRVTKKFVSQDTNFFIQVADLAYHHDEVVDIISPKGWISSRLCRG